jgi:hypothetical protein
MAGVAGVMHLLQDGVIVPVVGVLRLLPDGIVVLPRWLSDGAIGAAEPDAARVTVAVGGELVLGVRDGAAVSGTAAAAATVDVDMDPPVVDSVVQREGALLRLFAIVG